MHFKKKKVYEGILGLENKCSVHFFKNNYKFLKKYGIWTIFRGKNRKILNFIIKKIYILEIVKNAKTKFSAKFGTPRMIRKSGQNCPA